VQIKANADDFIVEELPLYEPCGVGTHTYIQIEKREMNTHDATRRLATLLGKRAPDCGVAGLKDARAVTRQWISFEHVKEELLENYSDPRLRIIKVSRHGNKLKMGHLRGNRFLIRLRLADAAGLPVLALRSSEVLAALSLSGIPNFFGEQRFGWGGENGALGKMLVKGEVDAFSKAYTERSNGGRPADRRMRNLLVNAFQSELFNQVLAMRMPEIGKVMAGDLAWLHRNGAVFAIGTDEEVAREQLRADMFEISPSGPLFGPKCLLPAGKPGEIERQVLGEAGVTMDEFGRREAERQPGARRSLRIPFVEKPVAELEADAVKLSFALPPGAYATIVLREITGAVTDAAIGGDAS